jgi:hypothetical protein
MMKEGIQDFIKAIGDEGCYALTLCKIAEIAEPLSGYPDGVEPVTNIRLAVEAEYIAPDMTVLDGAAFLRDMTGRKWTKEYKPAGYKPVKGDYLIAEWFNRRTGLTHFTLEYPVKWNSLSDSVTVKEGAIRSYRLYKAARQ